MYYGGGVSMQENGVLHKDGEVIIREGELASSRVTRVANEASLFFYQVVAMRMKSVPV
jgi:hypothetical protein